MLKGIIYHNGVALAPGSEAFKLKTDGKSEALEKSMKSALDAAHKRGEIRRPEKQMTAKELYASLKTQTASGKYTHEDDAKALAGVQLADVKLRILMERAVIRALVTELLKVGAKIKVDNGEYTTNCKTLAEVMQEIQAADEETLRIEIDGRKGVYAFIYGNDGYDVICDCSLWLEGLEFSNKISELQDGFADEVYKEAKK